MKRLFVSSWFTPLLSVALALATYVSLLWLSPQPELITSPAISNIAGYMGLGAVAAAGVITLILLAVLKLISRIIRMRKNPVVQWLIGALVIAGWICFGWLLTGEPRYTPIAQAIIDFVARPLLLGSLIIMIIHIIMLPFLFLPTGKK